MEIEIGGQHFWELIGYHFHAQRRKENTLTEDLAREGYIAFEANIGFTTSKGIGYIKRSRQKVQEMSVEDLHRGLKDIKLWTAVSTTQLLRSLSDDSPAYSDTDQKLIYFGWMSNGRTLTQRSKELLRFTAQEDSLFVVTKTLYHPQLDDDIIEIVPKKDWPVILAKLNQPYHREYLDRILPKLRKLIEV